jgi:hypothetical protein
MLGTSCIISQNGSTARCEAHCDLGRRASLRQPFAGKTGNSKAKNAETGNAE